MEFEQDWGKIADVFSNYFGEQSANMYECPEHQARGTLIYGMALLTAYLNHFILYLDR